MNWLADVPVEYGAMTMLFVGALIGNAVNAAIHATTRDRRPIGPWLPPHPDAPPRKWFDRIPVLGWFFLRRETEQIGSAFWIRAILIELATSVGLAWLYWFEFTGGLLPAGILVPVPIDWIASQYLAHVLLIAFMLVATFNDFDERLISDQLTRVGTFVGLILAVLLPRYWALESIAQVPQQITMASPHAWFGELSSTYGLKIGIGCFVAWCIADMPLTVTTRRGWAKAVQYVFASMWRYGRCWMVMAVGGSAIIAGIWWMGGRPWISLLTALVGMAFSGGLIWSVRIIGRLALHKESMGFGDVMLMAMIGVYMGWQSSIIIFFLAPFVALMIVLIQKVLTGDGQIAFGPYLCVATLIVILRWPELWDGYAARAFAMLGTLVPQMMFICLVMMGGMLFLYRLCGEWLYGRAEVQGENDASL